MTTELLSLSDLPANLVADARTIVAVPDPNGGPAVPYKTALGFVFAQPIPAVTWTVDHGLSRFPQVTVVDTTGRQLDVDVTYVTPSQVVISGVVPFAGTAYLS